MCAKTLNLHNSIQLESRGCSHLVSAKCVPVGFAVDQASIFSLLPPNFFHADKKENLHLSDIIKS